MKKIAEKSCFRIFLMDYSDPTVYFVFFLLFAFNALYFGFAVSTLVQSGQSVSASLESRTNRT